MPARHNRSSSPTAARFAVPGLTDQIEHYAGLTEKVISQNRRRVINAEKVAAREKIVSLFEPYTP